MLSDTTILQFVQYLEDNGGAVREVTVSYRDGTRVTAALDDLDPRGGVVTLRVPGATEDTATRFTPVYADVAAIKVDLFGGDSATFLEDVR